MWNYNPKTRTTGDEGSAIIPRSSLEETIETLLAAGIRNRLLLIDILTAISGLSRQEVSFNVHLVCEAAGSEHILTTVIGRPTEFTKPLIRAAPRLR
jgi:hypothetical protein